MRSLGLALLTAAVAAVAFAPAAAAKGGAQKRALAVAAQEDLKLPVVLIDAPEGIVDEPKRNATMRVFDRDRSEDYNGRVGIEFRGFTSQQDDAKKSYGFETRKDSGENRNVSLLGMPKDDDWVLIASYRDRSMLRNFLAYSTARWMGRYASRTQLVELVVNNSYEGVYLLGEQLKVHKDRVDVDDSDLSGGYLLEMVSMRRTQGEQYFTTPRNEPVIYADPDRDDLTFGRVTWIRNFVGKVERRLYGSRFTDRRRGYRRYVDLNAAVDYMLLNELFRNADTFRNSTYMQKGVDEKLVLGPLWDFDHAIGNDGTKADNETAGWEYASSPWAERFYADPAFQRRMSKRWEKFKDRGLRRQIMRTIDSGVSQLNGGPQERNFTRWPDPRGGRTDHAAAVTYFKSWIESRFKWINGNVGTLGTSLQP